MSEESRGEAQSGSERAANQGELGQDTRTARRTLAATVLPPEAEDQRLNAERVGLLTHSKAHFADGAKAGPALCGDSDWADLRDQSERPAPDLA